MRLDLKVGFSCNSRCLFCLQGDKRLQFKNKPLEQLRQILLNNYQLGFREVVITGGECTIRNDILLLVSFAKQIGYELIQVQTNGRRLYYMDFCKALAEAGVNEFSISLHGSNAKIHDSLTQANGSFHQTIQGIRNLKHLGKRVMTNTVITKQNYLDLPEIARLLVSLKVDQFQLAFIHIVGNAMKYHELLVPRKTEVMPFVHGALDIGKQAGIRVMTEAVPYCFMQDHEDCVAEQIIPQTKIEDANWIIDDYTSYRQNDSKCKHEKCRSCKYYNLCEGPWKEYPKLYGWGEFEPVREKRIELSVIQ